jgi:murein DD-endopeptidase MepM/ murein hydrolase activator NlpD
MSMHHSLKDLIGHMLVRGIHALALGVGLVLLGVQRGLLWLDGPSPLASRMRPMADWIARYPRQITLSIGGVVLAATGSVFAVATLGPDPADITVATLTETLSLTHLENQALQIDQTPLQLNRSDTTRSSDSTESLLRRLGIVDSKAAEFMRRNPLLREALQRPGRLVTAEATDQQQLNKLTVRWLRNDTDNQFQRLSLQRDGQAFSASLTSAPLTASVRLSGGTVKSSLYDASDEARLPDAIVHQLTDIFSTQIDFHRTLRKGASFGVVYEVLEADGEPLRSGKVLSAEFINGDRQYQAVWFQPPGQKGSYYTMDGKSLRREYLAAPVAYTRKSSGVGVRLHPIFQTRMVHEGVDYASPSGTPTHSVGDGVIEFAGIKGGYGNVVVVRHSASHTTVYAHLSRIQVRAGQRVTQGQVIGNVGSTGWSTGPHLHFEFRINGRYTDPSRVLAQSQTTPISAALRPAFNQQALTARQQLAYAGLMRNATEQ